MGVKFIKMITNTYSVLRAYNRTTDYILKNIESMIISDDRLIFHDVNHDNGKILVSNTSIINAIASIIDSDNNIYVIDSKIKNPLIAMTSSTRIFKIKKVFDGKSSLAKSKKCMEMLNFRSVNNYNYTDHDKKIISFITDIAYFEKRDKFYINCICSNLTEDEVTSLFSDLKSFYDDDGYELNVRYKHCHVYSKDGIYFIIYEYDADSKLKYDEINDNTDEQTKECNNIITMCYVDSSDDIKGSLTVTDGKLCIEFTDLKDIEDDNLYNVISIKNDGITYKVSYDYIDMVNHKIVFYLDDKDKNDYIKHFVNIIYNDDLSIRVYGSAIVEDSNTLTVMSTTLIKPTSLKSVLKINYNGIIYSVSFIKFIYKDGYYEYKFNIISKDSLIQNYYSNSNQVFNTFKDAANYVKHSYTAYNGEIIYIKDENANTINVYMIVDGALDYKGCFIKHESQII